MRANGSNRTGRVEGDPLSFAVGGNKLAASGKDQHDSVGGNGWKRVGRIWWNDTEVIETVKDIRRKLVGSIWWKTNMALVEGRGWQHRRMTNMILK